MSFWGSLFGGSSPELNTLIGQYGKAGSSLLGQGQKNENTASSFFNSILSGDSSKTTQALAPAISSDKTSAQQQNKTNAVFGNRSGGNTASAASTNDRVHSDITNLIGSLTGSSASNLASLGSSQVGQGSGLLGQEQGAVQQRIENWSNSILGKGITGAVSAAESAGLGAGVGAATGIGAGAGANAAVFGSGGGSGGGSNAVPQVPMSMFNSLFQPQPAYGQ